MCPENKKKPNVNDIVSNLSVPMGLGRKISLLIRNNTYKMTHLKNVVAIQVNPAADSHNIGTGRCFSDKVISKDIRNSFC